MNLRFRPSSSSLRTAAVLVLGLASGLACTAIFKPRDDVQRCGTGDDCEPTGDQRYVAVCRFDPENAGLDSTKTDKICVADFKTIDCSIPTNPEEEFADLVDDCENLVLDCPDDMKGTRGCDGRTSGDTCDDGLELNDYDICVDPDDDEIIVGGADNRDFAIQDQFCKGFFCDERFVCDNDGNSATCVICNEDDPFGEGGCGTFYANGAPAPFYVLGDDLEDQCAAPDSQIDEPIFGECP